MPYRLHDKGSRLLVTWALSLGFISACDRPADMAVDAAPQPHIEDRMAGKSPAGVPLAMTGLWQRSAGTLTPTLLTDYGMQESAKTNVFDDPNVECRGYSIPRSTLSGFGVTKIEVGDDHVVIRYEANAGTRKLFLDGVTPAENTGVNGVSIGSIANGAVSIVSRDFGEEGENAFLAARIKGAGAIFPMGKEFTLFERYRMINADTLDFVMVMQDPKILQIPRVIHSRWTRLPDDTPFFQEECVLAEDEFFREETNE